MGKAKWYAVAARAREKFLGLDGVLGVGPGVKFRKGKLLDQRAIVVLVERKLSEDSLDKAQLIPPSFEGFPTDVREPILDRRAAVKAGLEVEGELCLATDYELLDEGKLHELGERQRADSDVDADAPTAQVIGDLFVIHDPSRTFEVTTMSGTTYDWIAAYNFFRASFGDDYDFITFYLDVDNGALNLGNAGSAMFNDVTGTGRPTVNNRAAWGTTRLLRYIYHSWFSLRTLIHEVGHQWLAQADYKLTAAGATQSLLHQDTVGGSGTNHWGRWPDNDNSCMDYDLADWIDNGDGTFNRVVHDQFSAADEEFFGFFPLDQYLMGLIPPDAVSDFKIVQSPSPAISNANPGPYTPAGGAVTINASHVVLEEGARNPDHLGAQRVFHQAVAVMTPSAATSSAFLTSSENWRVRHNSKFRRATGGRMMVDTSLLRPNVGDLYIRDNAADTGGPSSAGPFWHSPDIWVRNADDGGLDHLPTIRGQDNWVHARVHNHSAQPYSNVTVRFYLANFLSLTPGTEFLYPNDWNPEGLIGEATITVPAASGGVDGEAVAKVQWPAAQIPPAMGWHPCLLIEVIPLDPTPIGLHHVWDNRKLAQINITIIDPPAMMDIDPDAYVFEYQLAVGSRVVAAKAADLRIRAAEQSDAVELFLDPQRLVAGVEEHGKILEARVPIGAGERPGGKLGLEGIEPVEWEEAAKPDAHEIDEAFAKQHAVHGMRPVVLNGLPLLQVTDHERAAARIRLRRGSQRVRLYGVVSPFEGKGRSVTYDIVQLRGKRTVGGAGLKLAL